MNAQERLFLAIGGADPELVARSERSRRRSRRLLPCGLAAAACLTLALALVRVLPPWTQTPDIQPQPGVTGPLPEDPNAGQSLLPEGGSAIGTLRLLSSTPEVRSGAADFLIYVNTKQFSVCEEDGLYSIRSLTPLPEGFPECGMDIAHLPEVSPAEAKSNTESALGEQGLDLSEEEPSAALPGSLYLRASEGLEWNSRQAELWFADDGQGGAFVLTARYFLEAEEGMGARFRDMASSFRVVDLNKPVPDWMRTLYDAAGRLSQALLSDDLAPVFELLTEDSKAEAYGEDVWPEVSVLSLDYTLDDDRSPTEAIVSVKHRMNRVEGDSVSFLTMRLVRGEGGWTLDWSGLEK